MSDVKHLVMAGLKAKKPKHLKTFHAEEQHDGKFHVVRHSGNPKEAPVKHTADDVEAVKAALEEHMGTPNEGEQESEGAAPQAPGAVPGAAPSAPAAPDAA